MNISMISIPGKNYEMMTTQVTQELYESVMGKNPSWFKIDNEYLSDKQRNDLKKNTKNNPVEYVSWYDAIYFCNKLSEKEGLKPVYVVDGEKNVSQWNYKVHGRNEIKGVITQDVNANGYRLPTVEEWEYAAKGGQNYKYAGSNEMDAVAWYINNSDEITHPVGQKQANGYGLYDMFGNVWEWCWDVNLGFSDCHYNCGISWSNFEDECEVDDRDYDDAHYRHNYLGFRLVCSLFN